MTCYRGSYREICEFAEHLPCYQCYRGFPRGGFRQGCVSPESWNALPPSISIQRIEVNRVTPVTTKENDELSGNHVDNRPVTGGRQEPTRGTPCTN